MTRSSMRAVAGAALALAAFVLAPWPAAAAGKVPPPDIVVDDPMLDPRPGPDGLGLCADRRRPSCAGRRCSGAT